MNMHFGNKGIAPLAFNGHVIHDREEMLSLTDMWRAAGCKADKNPAEWLRQKPTQQFVSHIATAYNMGDAHIIETKRGRNGGTFAHWQIALAYAKYLSPEFHMWCNTVVREYMEGKHVAPTSSAVVPADLREMIERGFGIERMLANKVTGLESSVAQIAAAVAGLLALVQPNTPVLIRHGKTAGQIWKANGFPRLKVTGWFGNRLAEMGCQIEGNPRAEAGLTSARLFDPDRADTWLKNGGRELVERKISERRGQGALKLVQ